MSAFNCEDSCDFEPDEGYYLVAPCGYHDRDPTTNEFIITDETLAGMRRLLLCEQISYEPNVSENSRPKYGSCGGSSCTFKLVNYTIGFTLEMCKRDDLWVMELAHPKRSCQFEYVWAPWPLSCAVPSAGDFILAGTIKSPPTGWTLGFEDTTLDFEITATSCTDPMMCYNDITDTAVVAAPLIGEKTQVSNLTKGKAAA